MKIEEYGSGKEGDVVNDSGNNEKGDRKREGGSGHGPVGDVEGKGGKVITESLTSSPPASEPDITPASGKKQ